MVFVQPKIKIFVILQYIVIFKIYIKFLLYCFSDDILYIFEDPDQKLSCESIPLRFGRCKKVRKIHCDRPHSIEIQLISYSIILAPADCSQEEKWFNALNYAITAVSKIPFQFDMQYILHRFETKYLILTTFI